MNKQYKVTLVGLHTTESGVYSEQQLRLFSYFRTRLADNTEICIKPDACFNISDLNDVLYVIKHKCITNNFPTNYNRYINLLNCAEYFSPGENIIDAGHIYNHMFNAGVTMGQLKVWTNRFNGEITSFSQAVTQLYDFLTSKLKDF